MPADPVTSMSRSEDRLPEGSCPLPAATPARHDEGGAVPTLLRAKRIAVVGMTPDRSRAGNYVPEYLRSRGVEVIPVNPTHAQVMGLKSYPTLAEVSGGPVDVVLVFRRPEFCGQIARDAVACGAKGLWLQSGITSEEARRVAEAAGMPFVENRCMMVEMGRE
jgi:predicted CoA-binding protein